ncbi:MAG: MoaD/ThiS family protein [Candidatus Helarchaeota archaeon]|nr:MoaD/ThiS family protein [Candidatus Helarchaeota archaeon]
MPKNIKVQVIGPLKEEIGVYETSYDGKTIKEVVNQFINDYRDKLKKYVDATTGSLKYIMIILNNKHYLMLEDRLETVLKPDDCIKLALPVGGGGG